jgi:transcriptional regulator with XRE-family HTH domain
MSPMNVSAIGAYIREQREQAKISLRQLAQSAGISNPYLSQIERGLRRPSADILQQIAKGLRISAEALYVEAGILDDRPPGPSVREAVLGDPDLTERQKQMLIEVYESFRKENGAGKARTVLLGHAVPVDEAAPADADEAAPADAEVAAGETAAADDAVFAGEEAAADEAVLAGEEAAADDTRTAARNDGDAPPDRPTVPEPGQNGVA